MAEKPVPDWPDVMSQSGRKTWPCWPDPLAICTGRKNDMLAEFSAGETACGEMILTVVNFDRKKDGRRSGWWPFTDLNSGPNDYESSALTD